jgi:ribosomal protein S18 acetylase RimI-like enzyme
MHRTNKKIVYVSGHAEAPPMEDLAALWASSFDRPELLAPEGVANVTKAIQHSCTVNYVFCETEEEDGLSEGRLPIRQLIGFARTISDGHFAAQVLDVCVHEQYRKQGIGAKLVKNICIDTRKAGPQSLAVFVGRVRPARA